MAGTRNKRRANIVTTRGTRATTQSGEPLAVGGGGVTSADVQAVGYWSNVTNGDATNPEIIFDSFGDVVVGWTPTP